MKKPNTYIAILMTLILVLVPMQGVLAQWSLSDLASSSSMAMDMGHQHDQSMTDCDSCSHSQNSCDHNQCASGHCSSCASMSLSLLSLSLQPSAEVQSFQPLTNMVSSLVNSLYRPPRS